jgi:GT2 family glycosyltransferase
VGGLAGDFFAYYEDLDWSWRVRLAGLSVRYQPEGCVRHVGGATTGGPVDQTVQRLAARNRLLCLARNAPLPVLASELRRDRDVDRRTVARRLPRSLAQRARLHRAWETTPHAVWSRWAGVDERWPSSAPS